MQFSLRSSRPRATRGHRRHLTRYDVYEGPQPGYTEQVYYFELHGEPAGERKTLVMLRGNHGGKGVVLRFETDQLPALPSGKNTAGLRDGYVTGLEPGTNYPNPPAIRACARNRGVTLPVDGRYVTETTVVVLAMPKPSGRRARDCSFAVTGCGQDQSAPSSRCCRSLTWFKALVCRGSELRPKVSQVCVSEMRPLGKPSPSSRRGQRMRFGLLRSTSGGALA